MQSARTRLGADCGSDHELLLAKFKLKLKKVGSQETPGVTGKLALEYRMKQGKG